MKKTTKGAVAAGAAALLLAGGAGSFAAWNASGNTGASGTVTAGTMSVAEQEGGGVWKWVGGTKEGAEYNAANDKLVPGDKVSYTANYNVVLEGTNLKAKLTPQLGGITGDLATFLQVTPADATAQEITQSGTVPFTTVVTFNPDTTALGGATMSASLAGGTISLDQVLN